MGCLGCSVSSNNGEPQGCRSNGGCSSGGCNRLNTYDWLSSMEIIDTEPFNIVEVSFKNGARKVFFNNHEYIQCVTGDDVVVETGNGYDIGKICLSGELVRLQMKKKGIKEAKVLHSIIRRANERDMERLQEAREMDRPTMIRARAIARTLSLDMKIGDVEYQGDKRKATFFYTADGRVDFRELIRHFAREFRVKIEMRQIGARQESARIGGLGSCGRELCCSTWLTDFKSVTTAAARYQNLAINQSKLSGQCGRLKCCLNYELDTYLDALEQFPKNGEKLQTERGQAILVKTDIFKGLMYYLVAEGNGRGKIFALSVEKVKSIQEMNAKGEKPTSLVEMQFIAESDQEEVMDYGDVTGVVELPPEQKRKRRKNRKNRSSSARKEQEKPAKKPGQKTAAKPALKTTPKKESGQAENKPEQNKPKKEGENKPSSRSNKRRRGRGRKPPRNNTDNK